MMILAIKIRSFRLIFRKCLELVERKPELEDRLGETGPAQSAFRDLDSRKVRTPEGIHSLHRGFSATFKLKAVKASQAVPDDEKIAAHPSFEK